MGLFRFKGFHLDDGQAGMKIGTDAILLGGFIEFDPEDKCLDIGLGSGVISAILAHRGIHEMHGIEMDDSAFELAKSNLENLPHPTQFKLYHNSLQNFQAPEKFTLLVSNPPFFTKVYRPGSSPRDLARQSQHLSLNDLFLFALKHLSSSGSLQFIYPYSDLNLIHEIAGVHGFSLSKVIKIIPRKGKDANRVILKAERGIQRLEQKEFCLRNEDLSYTTAFKDKVKSFMPFL